LATVNKDFKVKNGLQVTGNAVVGGTIAASTPTLSEHVATKGYVDLLLTTGTPVGPTPPENPIDGKNWFDTNVERLKFFYDGDWITLATSNDFQNIPDHIHDTAIDGTGRIVTIFWDGQSYDDPQIQSLDGGSPSSTTWDVVFDGGLAIDNFN
jgi:hypothetical protein